MPLNKIKKRISVLRQHHHEFWAAVNQNPPSDAMKFEFKQATPEEIEMADTLLHFALSMSKLYQQQVMLRVAHPA